MLLGSGLVLYLPALSSLVADRPLVKAVHLVAAAAWLTCLALVAVVGNRDALRRTRRDLERFDDDDRAWLRSGGLPSGGRPAPPQGRFNAGQKAHAVVQAALAVLFTVSGVLLWAGERDHGLRFPSTIVLHDAATFIAAVLVAGHLVLALVLPATRPALRGMTRGTVDAAWARRHHAKWTAAPPPPAAPLSPARLALAAAVLAAGAALVALVA